MAEERIEEERESELRVKLLKRLAIAGVMVTLLLGVLAFFDYLAKPEEPDAPVFTKPVPVPPKKEMSQPVKPGTDLPAPPQTEVKPAEPPPKPEAAAPVPAPAEDAPGKPVSKATPEKTAPAAEKTVPGKQPAERAAAPEKPVEKGVPEGTAAPGAPAAAPASTPVARPSAAESQPAAPPARPSLLAGPRLLRGYVVQAGVFSSARAAEELHAKLALNGIASTLEARVSVGPFKTREEAAAAQVKMKALGIEGMLVPPTGRR